MRQENHASPKRGISKMKSQGSAASNRKTLQSQIRQSAQNRLSINALDIVHGQLITVEGRLRTLDQEQNRPSELGA
jgi:hypothetical protein